MKSIKKILTLFLVTAMLFTSMGGCTNMAKVEPLKVTPESNNAQSVTTAPNQETYFINLDATDEGTVSAARGIAVAGMVIAVSVTPKEGYIEEGITAIKEGNTISEPISGKNGVYTFKMPTGNVTVKGIFKSVDKNEQAKNSQQNIIIGAKNAAAEENKNFFQGAKVSTNNENSSYPITQAFDGILDPSTYNRWVTAIGGVNPAVVNIELTSPAEISSVVISERYFGGDPDSRGRITKFSVYSIDDSGKRTAHVESLAASAVAKGDTTSHRIKFDAVTSSKFEIQLTIHAKGLVEGANIMEIQGFATAPSEPLPLPDPDAPEKTKDFAVGGKIVASSEMFPAYAASNATLPYESFHTQETRWGAPTSGEDVTAEIAFAEPAIISFVKVLQYEGPKPTGWGRGNRISNIKIELADDGEPYTLVASSIPTKVDSTGLGFVLSGITKTLETPMTAVRMRVTLTPNSDGRVEGLNIKAMEAYGVANTAIVPTRNAELRKALNAAYSKNSIEYTPESWAGFTPALIATRAIYSAGDAATEAQITSAINNMCDATYALVKKEVKTERVKIAFVGDSITYGHFLDDPGSQCFPATVQNKLGTMNYEIKNFAISGRTLSNTSDLPYMKETLYQNSLDYNPDVVIIMLGTNDSKPKYNLTEAMYAADARKLINSYKLLDCQPVIFFNTAPKAVQSLGDGNDVISPSGVAKVVEWQKTIAKQIPNIFQMDMFKETAEFTADDYRANDGVHPSKQGHDKIADIVISNMNKTKPTLLMSCRLYLLSLKDLDAGGYKPEVWTRFDDARKTLTELMNNPKASAFDINAAKEAVEAAHKVLADNIDNSKVRIACVGDSITRGDGGGEYTYPVYLQSMFNKNEPNRFIVNNFGENGMMASDRQGCGLTDPKTSGATYPYYDKYTASLGFLPNVVTIKLGTNDAKYVGDNSPKFKNDMKKIISAYQALPSNPQIILITSARAIAVPNVCGEEWANSINNTMVPLQRELADELGLPLIDINMYTKYSYDNGLSTSPSDGIHGNYKTISEGIWNALMGDGKIGGNSYVRNDPAAALSKKYLNAEIESGKALMEKDFTAASWSVYQAKLTAAKDMLANKTATVTQISLARTELKAAQSALAKK